MKNKALHFFYFIAFLTILSCKKDKLQESDKGNAQTLQNTEVSSSYLVLDEKGNEEAIFSGDTLFLGDVGRPDLAQKAASMTQEDLAGILFNSLRTKIMTLPDEVTVYPGHGAGSACGKNMSKETIGSIGHEKNTNYALRADMTKEEFIKEVTDGLLPPPAYFPQNVKLNKEGYADIDEVLTKGQTPIKTEDFEQVITDTGALMLDVRHQSEFAKKHIPRSIFIGVYGGFAPWVGALIKDVYQPIVLIADKDKLEETITRLSRVGFDNILGYLEGGVEAWEKAGKDTDSVETITAENFAKLNQESALNICDVRKENEHLAQHIVGAKNTSLEFINDYLDAFSATETNYIHCAGGYRSMIANSILKSRGIHNIVDVLGGFGVIRKTEIKLSDAVC